MSTKIHNAKYSTAYASHGVVFSLHGSYGHNRDISETVFPYGSRLTVPVHSASCLSACGYAQAGELKSH